MKNLFRAFSQKNENPVESQPGEMEEIDEQDLEQVTGISGNWINFTPIYNNSPIYNHYDIEHPHNPSPIHEQRGMLL